MREIFRKSSLEKLSSPEQLDKMIKTTTISSWLLLLGAGMIVISIVLWAFLGEMSEEKNITGIYMQEGGVQSIYSSEAGTVGQILVGYGDQVSKGEDIAIVSGIKVKSQYEGIINSVAVEEGQLIDPGTQIAELRIMDDQSEKQLVRSYVDLNTAKQLSVPMEVTMVPATLNEEEYGHMRGYIKSVGTYGVSERDMYSKLGDDALVQSFRSSYGNEPIVEVMIEINPDEKTVNGYEWSNEMGKDLLLQDFTYMSVRIVLNKQRPIHKLLGI